MGAIKTHTIRSDQLTRATVAGASARLRRAAHVLLALVLIVFGAPCGTGWMVLAQSHVLFVSIVDRNGEPVTDLQLDELVVQWDGENSETLDLEPVGLPVRVTVLIDNAEDTRAGLQHMREGLKGFLDALPEDVEIALLTLARQPRWITRHTTDRDELARGLELVTPDYGTSARFLDGWLEAATRIDEDAERQYLPVILMLAGDGIDGSSVTQGRYRELKKRMTDISATMHTRMFSSIGNAAAPQAQIGIEMANLTRGTYQALAAPTAFRTQLPELGQDIARKHKRTNHQYRVTYAPPDDAFDRPTILVGTPARPGLDLIPTTDGNVP